MIPPFLISFLSTNALKIGIVVAVITAVGGGLWYIQHQAYDKGYKEGYAEMEVLHNTEVAKSAKEVARIISDNAKRYEEETNLRCHIIIDNSSFTFLDLFLSEIFSL